MPDITPLTKEDLICLWPSSLEVIFRAEWNVDEIYSSRLMIHLQVMSHAVIYKTVSNISIMIN